MDSDDLELVSDGEDEDYEILQSQRERHPRRRTRATNSTVDDDSNEPTTSHFTYRSSRSPIVINIPVIDIPVIDTASDYRTRSSSAGQPRNDRRNTYSTVDLDGAVENFNFRIRSRTEDALSRDNNTGTTTRRGGRTRGRSRRSLSPESQTAQIEEILEMIEQMRQTAEAEEVPLDGMTVVMKVLNHFCNHVFSHLIGANDESLNEFNNNGVLILNSVLNRNRAIRNSSEQEDGEEDNPETNELTVRMRRFAQAILQIVSRNRSSSSERYSFDLNGRIINNIQIPSILNFNDVVARIIESISFLNTIPSDVTDEMMRFLVLLNPVTLNTSRQNSNEDITASLPTYTIRQLSGPTFSIQSRSGNNTSLHEPSTSAAYLDLPTPDEAAETEDVTETNDRPLTAKKRKRSKAQTAKRNSKLNFSVLSEDDDDGSTCPVCLDHWDLTGNHRLTSLKCGHLFGDSCIRRWLRECPQGGKTCPSCKTKVGSRDLRFIYAKRVRTNDNTEEMRLRAVVEAEKTKNARLQTNNDLLSFELKTLKSQVTKLEEDIERMSKVQSCVLSQSEDGNDKGKIFYYDYKMYLTKNITITQEAGCRVLSHSKLTNNLIISQKSSQSLFNGFGVKFIDIHQNFRPTNFLYTSQKSVRDLSFSPNEELIACASMEITAKIFDVRQRQSAINLNLPTNQTIWACAFDKEYRENTVYLGSQHGSTYIYDIRNRSQMVDEQSVEGDLSPVIQILPVPLSTTFPLGGIWVCKLQSLWFYEILPNQELNATRIAVEGPFMAINYDIITGNILISTRNCTKTPMGKYILGRLKKVNDIVVWDCEIHLFGSKVTPVMSRCTQIALPDNNSLIAAYVQDARHINLWNVGECTRVQSLPCSDVVYDTCSIKLGAKIFLAASTDMKCRIYEILSTSKR